MPLCIIPDRGQVSENSAKPSSPFSCKQTWDVLHKHKAGSNLANKAVHFAPQSATLGRYSGHFSRKRKVLAGEASADDIGRFNSADEQSFESKFLNIVIDRNLGPVLAKDGLRERLDLTERDGLESARALQSEVEPANAGEEGEDAEGHANHPH
jgi:hypothetical protein